MGHLVAPLHHAYVLDGYSEEISQELLSFLEDELNIHTSRNPDIISLEYETLGIDDARRIKEMQSRKSIGEDKQIFILKFNFITREAQNSLLKVLEEPTARTHFFLIVPSKRIFLPTLLSRVLVVSSEAKDAKGEIDVFKFVSSNSVKRIKLLDNIIEEKNKLQAILFLNDLESVFHESLEKGKWTGHELAQVFSEIEKGRNYLYARSPSVKMILEHLSLTLPVF